VQGEVAVVDDSIATLPAVELAAGIRSGKFTSRELLELYLDRVDRLNPPINAVVTLDAERARTAADEADAALARVTTSARCTDCRSRSRTRSRPRASARPVARSS